jgi:hypothetical protein
MSTPAPDPNETSRMKRIMDAGKDDSVTARLPRGTGNGQPPPPPRPPVIYAQPYQEPPAPGPFSRFLPAFWTIASLISMVVNVILVALILILFDMVGGLQNTANDQVSSLMGGLYQNFEMMERATISRSIPVDANIPLNIMVPVQARNQVITLSQPADIRGVQIDIVTSGFTLHADNARVILPLNTPLTVNFDLQIPVQNTIPVHLDVPVNIPLRETQLYEPFVGLQEVIEPWYCLVEPNALVMGEQICSPYMNPEGSGVDAP